MPRLRGVLLGETMLGWDLFDAGAIAQMLDEHEAGRFNHESPLWLLLVFEGFLATEMGGIESGPVRENAALA
jgi:asparagine synthase (glutamine-hydrolysing)